MGTQKRNRILAILAVSVFALFAGLSGWMIWSNQLPPLMLPVRVAPVPNAFDTLTLAHKKLVTKVGTADIKGTRVAATPTKPAHDFWGTPTDRAALTRENAETIRLIRVALNQDYLSPITFRSDQSFTHNVHFKDMCRMLEAAARHAFETRQWEAGAEYSCDAIQLAQLIATNELVYGRLVGYSCENPVINLLSNNLDKLSLPSLKALYEKLNAIQNRREPLQISLENERVAHQAWIRELRYLTPSQISQVFWVDDKRAWMIMFSSKRAASSAADKYYAEVKRIAKLPYDRSSIRITRPTDPINDAGLIELSGPLFSEARNRTERALLLANLWVRLNGPVTELPAKFIDPFGKSAKLRYKQSASGFSLYSVGPDGVDDGGAAINDGFGKVGRIPRETSTGDMVIRGHFSARR